MFAKLAFRNVKRQLGNYLIYFITVSLTVALMFAFNSVIFEKELLARSEQIDELRKSLILITVFISVIVSFVLGYATSFMLKLRKREFGTYLTLGMTRTNIMSVFLFESLLLCVVSLGTGILLGLGFYQCFMAVAIEIMNVDFTFAAYSPNGLILTVVLVVGIFVLSSAASAFFLRRVSIYNLLHGARKTEKAVRHPVVWGIIAAVTLVGIIVSTIIFGKAAIDIMRGVHNKSLPQTIVTTLAVFCVCIIVFHIALSRGIIGLLMRTKKLKNRGANIFTLRQLSGRLSSSSILIGLLAFLITLAVGGTNTSFTLQIQGNAYIDGNYPFDVSSMVRCSYAPNVSVQPSIPFDEAEKIIQEYSPIKNRVDFTVYTNGSRYLNGFKGGWMEADVYIEESAFNSVYGEIGYAPVKLGDGFMIARYDANANWSDLSTAKLELGGKQLGFKGFLYDYPMVGGDGASCWVIVPDGATAECKPYYDGVVFSLKKTRYNAIALQEELMTSHNTEGGDGSQIIEYEMTYYNIRQYAWIIINADNAVFIVTALYIAIVFMFLAMAMLALKTLSGISDDKQRYKTLDGLGASKRDMCRTLFIQIFTFFALPFALPLLVSVPAGIICYSLMMADGLPAAATQAATAASMIALVMLGVYALYFTATYLISKRAVVPIK